MINDKITSNGDNTIIKHPANTLSSTVFILFTLFLPLFGVGIDFQESLFFYLIPPLLYFNLSSEKVKHQSINKKILYLLVTSLTLFFVSTITSVNIGMSYYHFWNFLTLAVCLTLYLAYFSKYHSRLESGIIIASVLYSLIFFAQKIGLAPPDAKGYGDSFLSQVWGHSYLGNFLIISTLLTISKINPKKPGTFLLPLFFICTIFFSYSRSALAAVSIGIFLLPNHFIKNKLAVLTLILFCVMMFISNLPGQEYKSLDGRRPEYFYQGISGFLNRPLIGHGPGTFSITNRRYLVDGEVGTNTSHNSVIDNLHNHGIFYTIAFTSLVIYGLYHQYRHNRLNFAIGFASFFGSLLDSYWSNHGILLISLIFLLQPSEKTVNKIKAQPSLFLKTASAFLLLFFFSKTISDYLFLTGNYSLSIKVDPFNLNSRLALIDQPQHLNSTLRFFAKEEQVYYELIKTKPLPQATDFYLEFINIHPKTSRTYQLSLMEFANQQPSSTIFDSLEKYYPLLFTNPPSHSQLLQFAKQYYLQGLILWKTNQNIALDFFQKAYQLAPSQSHYTLEYANALWHTNQQKIANKIISGCQNNQYASSHCSDYIKQYSSSLPNPGIFQKTISEL